MFTHFGNLVIGGSLDAAWGVDGERILVGEIPPLAPAGGWVADDPIPTRNTRDVWGAAADDVWAVGPVGFSTIGTAAPGPKLMAQQAQALSLGRSSSEIAAGANGTILKWDGERWTVIAFRRTKTSEASLASRGDVWAVGKMGTIMRRGELAWGSITIDPRS